MEQSPNSAKLRSDQAMRVSSKASGQGTEVNSERIKLRQSRTKPTVTEKTRTARVDQKTAAKSSAVRTANNAPARRASGVEVVDTPPEMPIGPDPFEGAAEKFDPGPALPKKRHWKFNDFVIALPMEVGAGFGVPAGCETRCKVEARFGPPDQEYHASTFFTLVDYSHRGLRFYYDKENRTMGYSTFPPPSQGRMPGPAAAVEIAKSKPRS